MSEGTQRIANLQEATSELVELFILDLTERGGELIYFHDSNKNGDGTITFQGNVYVAWAIQADGFEISITGTQPKPKLAASNFGSTITSLLRQYGDLVGCTITRKRTYKEFLDGEPGANPNEEYPMDIFVIDRRSAETKITVEFELSSKADARGVQLPFRQIAANACPFLYRGMECGYAGPPVTDKFGNLLTIGVDRGAYNQATTYALHDYVYVLLKGIRYYYVSQAASNTSLLTDHTKWKADVCTKTLAACKARFGANNPLPFGGFPGAAKLPRS